MAVYLFGTLDTKGAELDFLRELIRQAGLEAVLVDVGCLGTPTVTAEILREAVFEAAGSTLAAAREQGERGVAIRLAAAGVAAITRAAMASGHIEGALAIGGSAGSTIGAAALRELPLGVPKVLVSTLAAGQTRPYVGGKDITLVNPVVDLAGLNRITRAVLTNAAGALIGMLRQPPPPAPTHERPLIAATMFGVTTPCVEHARKLLEAAGYEVVVFHATGAGGEAMESLIRDGQFVGVLDITTTELADELVGGVLSAGPTRLTAAGARGIPQVISVGALDMVNFGPRNTIPPQFSDRRFHEHNATVTLMRTTTDENRQLGEEIGRKAQAARGPVELVFPRGGVSAIDAPGKPFQSDAARTALLVGLESSRGPVPLTVIDAHINDPAFAEACVSRLLALLKSSTP
jgi:uncharacterized protein (UPF0261 family)